jgi:Na+-transporting methylmalonyl-CoA/oxaloacetate decarboxylase gamma subunit
MQRFSFQNVLDAEGISLAVIGMLIVFSALTLISLFIAALPKVLDFLNDYLPEPAHHDSHAGLAGNEPDEEELIIAALGYVLHRELHKVES